MSSSVTSVESSVPPPSTTVSTPGETPSVTPPPTTTSGESSTSLPPSTSELSSTSSTSTLPPSSTSSSSSTSTSPPSRTPTPSESPSTFLSVSNGNTIVVTTVIRSTPSSTTSVASSSSSKGFFNNTGAVAGTFSVVGLVGLGILIFIVTAVIRRRRAEKFDKDVALAAAEAAATAHNPDFDDYGYGPSGHGAGSYGYADTYQQDPVKFPPTREAYGMSEIGGTTYADPDNYSVGTGGGPGAAGIGAGVLYRSKSGKNQQDPYNAYAVHHDLPMPQHQASLRFRNPAQNHWEDPNVVGGGYDVAHNVSQPYPDDGIARSKSLQSNGPDPSQSSHYSTDPLTQDPQTQPPPMPESYLDHYRTGFDPEKHHPQTRPLSTASMTDAYSGVTPGKPFPQQPPVPEKPGNASDFPNPFDSQTSGDLRLSDSSDYSEGPHPGVGYDDPRMSLRDDEDYGAGRRVLKVANE